MPMKKETEDTEPNLLILRAAIFEFQKGATSFPVSLIRGRDLLLHILCLGIMGKTLLQNVYFSNWDFTR